MMALNPHRHSRVTRMQPLEEYSRQRDSGGLPPAGREHQRPSTSSDRSGDVALGENQGSCDTDFLLEEQVDRSAH